MLQREVRVQSGNKEKLIWPFKNLRFRIQKRGDRRRSLQLFGDRRYRRNNARSIPCRSCPIKTLEPCCRTLQPLQYQALLLGIELVPVFRRAEVAVGKFLEGRECASAVQASHSRVPISLYQFVIHSGCKRYAYKYLPLPLNGTGQYAVTKVEL